MNKLVTRSIKTFFKYRSILTPSIRPFATKKTTKPTSGSDVEANKSKKSVRGSSSDNETPKPERTSESSAEKLAVINSVPGHKSPFIEETVSGRYAQTLFMVGSQANELYRVYQDMVYIADLYNDSETFRTFANNSGLNSNQINSFFQIVSESGEFCKSTIAFADLLGKNKRFMFINEVANKFIRFYVLIAREEKIKIVSAHELNASQRDRVKEALSQNAENQGRSFVLDFEVNPNILGGLQLYSENKFMDLSLGSRLEKLKDEASKFL